MKKYKELLKKAPLVELWDPPFYTKLIIEINKESRKEILFHKYYFFEDDLRSTPYIFVEDDRKRVMSLSKRKKYIITKLFELNKMGCEALLMVKNSSNHSFIYATNDILQDIYYEHEEELFKAMGCIKLGKTIRHTVEDEVEYGESEEG